MKKFLLSLITAVTFLFPLPLAAQDTISGRPYRPGENLIYEAKYKTFGLSFSVADFKFSVSRAKTEGDFYIKSIAKSRGTLAKLFNFTFLQQFESTVNGRKLNIMKTVKRDEQRKRIRDSEANFDYNDHQVLFIETDPNDPTRPPRRVASSIEENTHDIVTAVYMLRRMPFSVGRQFIINVSDSGLVYKVPVNITGRERRKSIFGKIWCWKIEPEIFGEGRFIEQKGKLEIWISDDGRRVPVRAKLDTTLGSVEIKLKRIAIVKRQPAEDKELIEN